MLDSCRHKAGGYLRAHYDHDAFIAFDEQAALQTADPRG